MIQRIGLLNTIFIYIIMDVSVIIVNYNTKELTAKCIDSIYAQTFGVSFEVILVDNASTDGSAFHFERDDRIHFVKSDINLGFGKANNLGYKYAEGRYIFLLNSDTVLLNNAIKLFYDKMESSDMSVGCMGCLLEDPNHHYVHSYADFPKVCNMMYSHVSPRLFRLVGYGDIKMDDPKRRERNPSFFQVEYVTGADLFIRKEVIEECGMFDPDFFMYYEDPEMQHRFVKRGYFSFIFDAPRIVHLEGRSMKPDNRKMFISFDSHLKYLRKTQPKLEVLILQILLLFKWVFHCSLTNNGKLYFRSIMGMNYKF